MHWKTVNKKKELIVTKCDEAVDGYYVWLFNQPVKRTLAGRNDRGRNIIYLHGTFGGGIRRRRKIFTAFKKGWYAYEQ